MNAIDFVARNTASAKLIKFWTKITPDGAVNKLWNGGGNCVSAGIDRRQCLLGSAISRSNGRFGTASTFRQSNALAAEVYVGSAEGVVALLALASSFSPQLGVFDVLPGDVLQDCQIIQYLAIFTLRLRRIVVFLGHGHSP
ncbi:MAG: hypothetical protein HQL44_15150 [Alphaproteobacteria bacterium]|nr:hypothetical protein [Alphaproteobacteria bacterium]